MIYDVGMRQMIFSRLQNGENTIGYLAITKKVKMHIDSNQLNLIKAISAQLSVALANINANEQIENQIKESESNTKTQLESLSEKFENQSKYFKKLLIWLGVFLLSVLIFYLNYTVFNFIEKVKDVIQIVIGLSGLWSFGSFIINLLKSLKWIN
jgi:hypothetical protein